MSKNIVYLSARRMPSVLRWANFCKNHKDYYWTKFDDILCEHINEEVKRQRHQIYLNRKNKEVIPFHLT